MYEVIITRKVSKAISKLRGPLRERVEIAITSLAEDPGPQGYIKIKGEDDTYRIQVGNYRIIYLIIDDKLVVTVTKFANRSDAYKKK